MGSYLHGFHNTFANKIHSIVRTTLELPRKVAHFHLSQRFPMTSSIYLFSGFPRWPPNGMTYIVPDTLVCGGGGHKATSPCKFEHTAGECYWVMGLIELMGNLRWLPNSMTYMVPDTHVCGGPQDHFTMWVWTCCGQLLASYGPHWVAMKSKMAADPHHLNHAWHTCTWGTNRTTSPCEFECAVGKH